MNKGGPEHYPVITYIWVLLTISETATNSATLCLAVNWTEDVQ